jgi:hypothetical protein
MPLPSSAWSSLSVIGANCEGIPASICAGLSRYDKLNFQEVQWKNDPFTVDVNLRMSVPDDIRTLLRTHDGALSLLAREKATIERVIQETGWPVSAASPVIMTTGTPPGQHDATRGLTVDAEFRMG